MNAIKIILGGMIALTLMAGVGAIETSGMGENERWQVRCDHEIISYVAPERISLQREIALCEGGGY